MKIFGISFSWRLLILVACIQLFSSATIDSGRVNRLPVKTKRGLVYVFEIRQDIAKPAWKITQDAFKEAEKLKADYIIIHLNTYGGMVNIADSIRTKILNSPVPVLIFIDNQAISAGALISIAGDSIYMRPGGSIGAATVVNQSGEVVPDKYQSFMRSTMRATAEAHGKDTIIKGTDTTYKWHRDPQIAQAMVDPRISIPDLIDSTQVLTLTVEEAIRVGFCEGKAANLEEVLDIAGLKDYEVRKQEIRGVNKLILLLLNPIAQTILILLIVGGIYFELQTPGIGFPLGIAIFGALLYFFPLYIQGLAENWEVLIFVLGVILLGLEIFVIPGFGIAGIGGILLIVIGLTMGVIDNVVFEFEGTAAFSKVAKVFFRIIVTIFGSFALSIWISKRIGTTRLFSNVSLDAAHDRSEGFVGVDVRLQDMVGQSGIAFTTLRPSGRIKIGEEIFDAKAEIGFIDKGTPVKVIRTEAGQLYVIKL